VRGPRWLSWWATWASVYSSRRVSIWRRTSSWVARSCGGEQIGCGHAQLHGRACLQVGIPGNAVQLAGDCLQGNVAHGTALLSGPRAQALMQLLGNVPDLQVGHGMMIVCLNHACEPGEVARPAVTVPGRRDTCMHKKHVALIPELDAEFQRMVASEGMSAIQDSAMQKVPADLDAQEGNEVLSREPARTDAIRPGCEQIPGGG
jgi:hypothetical protein